MSKTIYDIGIKYSVDNKASSGLGGIADQADRADRATMGLKGALIGLGVVWAGEKLFEKGTQAFIGFNSEMEMMRIQAATMLQSNDLVKSFDQGTEAAQRMLGEFQRFAITSPVTTKDLMQFGNGISVAVAQAGGGIKDIEMFAERGVIAAKALGANADYAALEITEGIQKGMTARQRFLKQLTATQGVSQEQFNAMNAADRMKVLSNAINSPAMKAAAKAFGDSFEGVTSTLKDNIEIGLGKVGLPLFKAVTAEIKSWNEWLGKNQHTLERWSKDFTETLKTGFESVKTMVSFIVDNKDTLITIAEAYAVIKVGQGVGGTAANAITGLGAMQTGITSIGLGGGGASAVGAIASIVGSVITVAAVVAGATWLAGRIINDIHKDSVNFIADHGDPMGLMKRFNKNGGYRPSGGIDADGNPIAGVNMGQEISSFLSAHNMMRKEKLPGPLVGDKEVADKKLVLEYISGLRMKDAITEAQGKEFYAMAMGAKEYVRTHALVPLIEDARKMKKEPKINVNVKMEVATDDPDRFAIQFVKAIKNVTQYPTMSKHAARDE